LQGKKSDRDKFEKVLPRLTLPGQPEAIQTTCKFKVAEASEQIFELAENTWAVYSTGTRHARSTQEIWSVEPGCYIRTMDHVISAMIEIQKKTMDWTGELAELFGRANTEGIHTAIQGLRTKYDGEFDASKLFKDLDQIQPAKAHWTFLNRGHDWNRLGHLPDRHAHL